MKVLHFALLALPLLAACGERSYFLGELAPLPGIGVAGAFCGVSGEDFVVAGGSNFPDGRPWDGGAKRYSAQIHALQYQHKGREWRALEASLPRALAYGVSVPGERGVVCVGGRDAERCYAEAFELRVEGERARTRALPALPEPRAFACAARVGDAVLVFGGIARVDAKEASNALFSLDLRDAQASWKREAPLPGVGRMLAVAGQRDGRFYVVGGCALEPGEGAEPRRRYLREAWCFERGAWRRVADLPAPRAGAPSPMLHAHGQLLCMGGDPGGLGGVAPRDRHPGFATDVWGLAPEEDRWLPWPPLAKHRGPSPTEHPELGQMPQVTAPTAVVGKFGVIASGEIRPGVRCKRISIFVPGDEDTSRAYLVLALILGLAVVPTVLVVLYAFRVFARAQRA